MAGVKLDRILATAALALCWCVYVCGQSAANPRATGTLTGRLTDLHSTPLLGISVVVRNEATGAETPTTTALNGEFRAEFLQPGFYTVTVEDEQLGRGELNGILVQASHEARVQTAMAFEPLPPKPLVIAHHEIPTDTVLVAFAYPLTALRLWHPASVLMPAFVHDLPPTEVLTVRLAYPLAALRVWSGPAVLMPAFVHDLPPTETWTIHAAMQSGLRPLAVLKSLPTVAADQPLVKESSPVAAHRASVVPPAEPGRVSAAAGLPTAGQPAAAPAATRPADLVQAEVMKRPAPTAEIASNTMTAADLQQLPVSGRRWEEFAEMAPGAQAAEGSGRAGIRGEEQFETSTSVDGVNTRLAFGSPSGQGHNATGQTEGAPEGTGNALAAGRGMAVSEAAIRSFETAAGFAEAEADHAAGGRAQVSTLQGSNGLHGQGFLFGRQGAWGARNPFTQWTRETAAGTATTLPSFSSEPYTPPDHEMVLGMGLGRQIRKDRLFWFAALDYLQRYHPGVAQLKHPDLFFAAPTNDRMQLLGAQVGSGSQAIPRYTQMLETLAGLLGPAARSTTQWTGFGRVDWNLKERYRMTVEGNGAHWDSPGGGFNRTSEAYGNHSFGSSQAGEQWLAGRLESYVTPNLLSATQLHWSRTILSAHAEAPSAYEQTLNINNWGQLPQIVVDSRNGFTIGNPARFGAGNYPDEKVLHLDEALSWAHDNLLVKAGFQLDHAMDSTTLVRNQTGTYHYATVENFATDALAFIDLGIAGSLDRNNQHNCDQTGKAWRDSAGGLRGLGYLPCYAYYTQTMGPAGWHASTNEAALYLSAQWQVTKYLVASAGLRWEREQLPASIHEVDNPKLPFTQKTPTLGNNWGPRVSLAFGPEDKRWPVLHAGYGIYYGRVMNSTLLTMLSHTGSFNGDLSFYLRPTDNLNAGGAPPFPYAFSGEPLSVVKPGAIEFAPNFRNPEIHQAMVGVEEKLPLHIEVTASAMVSLARHLPVTVDTNINPAVNPGSMTYSVVDASGKGPIKAARITVPFYADWPVSGTAGRLNTSYQQVVEMLSRANSTYEAATIRVNRYGERGLTVHAHYTYAHAMDWNPNESLRLTGGSGLDPEDFSEEYGVSNLDVRHTAAMTAILETPWKLQGLRGRLANGWALSGMGHYRSGMPYTIRTAGTLTKAFVATTGASIVALGTGMNGSGGDNRIYGLGSDGVNYHLGRNTYRYPATWKADLRLTKRLNFSARRQLELMIESFNLFNHQNVTELETVGYTIESGSTNGELPSLNFLTGLKANTVAFGQPYNVNATNFYQPRQIELGVRMRF
jgi:hypothetical protein